MGRSSLRWCFHWWASHHVIDGSKRICLDYHYVSKMHSSWLVRQRHAGYVRKSKLHIGTCGAMQLEYIVFVERCAEKGADLHNSLCLKTRYDVLNGTFQPRRTSLRHW